jgi:AcrR family transcriptional regulator
MDAPVTQLAQTTEAAGQDAEGLGLSSLIQQLTEEELIYATPAIFERRRRILTVARQLIQQHGYTGFTVRDVCDQAGVSPHTLYRAFESRERLIAVVIAIYVRDFRDEARPAFPEPTLEDAVCRLMLSNRTMLSNPALSKALVAIHYSATADATLQRVVSGKGQIIHADWTNSLFHQGQLRRGLTPAKLIADFTTILFSVCWEWARGRIADEDFLDATLTVMLTFAAGATRGGAQAEAGALLADLLGPRKRIRALEERIEATGTEGSGPAVG